MDAVRIVSVVQTANAVVYPSVARVASVGLRYSSAYVGVDAVVKNLALAIGLFYLNGVYYIGDMYGVVYSGE